MTAAPPRSAGSDGRVAQPVIRAAGWGLTQGLAAFASLGDIVAVLLEGLRHTGGIRRWWWEFVGQFWFLVKVTAVPVALVTIPLGATIGLQIGSIMNQIGAASVAGGG